jgi:hypothetical protein
MSGGGVFAEVEASGAGVSNTKVGFGQRGGRVMGWAAGQGGLGLILGGSLFYARVTFKTLVVFNFKVP